MWDKVKTLYHYHKMLYKKWMYGFSLIPFFSQRKLQRLLRYAKQKIPYYANWDLTQFEAIPIVDKSILQDNFKELNSLGFSYEETLLLAKKKNSVFNIRQSIGTSGSGALFISTDQESIKAFGILLKKILYPRHTPAKVALFYLSPEPYFSHSHLTKKLEWHYFNLRQDFEKLCTELRTFSPDVLIAPVQTLRKLAQLQQENKIKLSLKKIIATAEVLTTLDEKMIQDAFGQVVHQLYQCAEGWLGATCEYGTLHLNESSFLIEKEYVDDEKVRFIPVITTLDRFVQPLIRYRMEDILVKKLQTCPCGDPSLAVERITGRCEDVLYFPKKYDHRILIPVYPDNLHQVLDPIQGNVTQYQIIQLTPHHLVIKLQAKDFDFAKCWIERNFVLACEKYQVKAPSLNFIPLESVSFDKMFRRTMRQSALVLQ